MYRDDSALRREQLREKVEDGHRRLAAASALTVRGPCKPLVPKPPTLLNRSPRELDDAALAEADLQADEWHRLLARAERFNALLVHSARHANADGSSDRFLRPGHRRIPLTYRLAELTSGWVMYPLILVAIGHAAGEPTFYPVAGILLLAALIRSTLRTRFLADCEQAPNVSFQHNTSPPWYQDSTQYKNWPLRESNGWNVATKSFTGSGVAHRVTFETLDGEEGKLELGGRGYTGGVVLYSPRTPAAYDVRQFWCAPVPTPAGTAWTGKLGWRVWARIVIVLTAFAFCVARWFVA